MSHISIFSANYLPNTGGVERYTYNLSKELSSRGHKVTIITSNVFNLKEYEVIDENIEIYRLPCINLMAGRYPVLRFWNKEFKNLNTKIKSNKYDLTIVNTRFYFHSLYGAGIGKKHSNKVIAIEHGSAHLTLNSKFWDFFERIFEHSITFIIKRYVKDFYGVSSKCNEWLKHFGIKAKGTLYNAVDINEIETIKIKNSAFDKSAHNIPDNAKIISFTGRLVYEKGIIQLIEAVKLLNDEYKRNDIHLLVAGDGPLHEECERLKNKNIHLLGKLSFNDVIQVLSCSHIFCFPSFYPEGFPTSVLEAVCTSNYIISTPVAGISELLLDESYGTILSACPDSREIAMAILSVVDDNSKMEIACKKCLDLVKNEFTWKNTADKVDILLK